MNNEREKNELIKYNFAKIIELSSLMTPVCIN